MFWRFHKNLLFFLLNVTFPEHFLPYTLIALSFFWKFIISMLVEPILYKNSWIWIPIGPPVKFWTCFPALANNRNLNFREKLQNGLCSCPSWSNVWHTIEIYYTNPESLIWAIEKYKKHQNHLLQLLDKNTPKLPRCTPIPRGTNNQSNTKC